MAECRTSLWVECGYPTQRLPPTDRRKETSSPTRQNLCAEVLVEHGLVDERAESPLIIRPLSGQLDHHDGHQLIYPE
jgi:hypothetical protein